MPNCLQLRYLTDDEVNLIYDKCLHILMEKGVKVEYSKALKILDASGAHVDYDFENVRFPIEMIQGALDTVPKNVTVKGSQAEYDMVLPHPRGSFYTSTCVQTMQYHDPVSNRFVDVTKKHLAEWTQLAQVLPNVHKIAIQTPTDAPHETADVHALNIHLRNTAKPLMVLAYCPESVEYLFELMLARAGSVEALLARPIVLTYPTSLSPLKFKPIDMETIIQSCRYGIPIVGNSLAISAATAPVTIAGTALLAGVEVLAMLVMSQIFAPGIPFIPSIYTTSMDMVTGSALLGNTEGMLGRAAATQFIKEKFKTPVETFSFMTDSYLSDGQTMVEKTLMPAMLNLAGSDIQYGIGRLGGSTAASPIQMIIDDQLVTIIDKCTAKIAVNEDTLALTEIMENAPDGNFVTSDHTLKYCRENIRPDLFVTGDIENWQSAGRPDLYARAVEKYQALRKALRPQPLPVETIKEMDKIVKQADRALIGKL